MGKLMTVKLDKIRPAEDDFLNLGSMINVLGHHFSGTESQLMPTTVRDSDIGLLQIDGRHRAICEDLFGTGNVSVYLVDGEQDHISEEEFPQIDVKAIEDANRVISYRYQESRRDAIRLKDKGIVTYRDLRSRLPFLKDVETAREFYKQNKNSGLLREYPRY